MFKFTFANRTFQSFSSVDFRLLWIASMGTSGGYFFQQVCIGWVTYELTNSAFITALALALDTLPNLFGAPLGGVLVDRLNKQKILIFGPCYQFILSVGFGIGVYLDKIEVWHILTFVFLMGCSWILIEPARMAITADMLDRSKLINGFALTQLAFSISRLVGPGVGGVLISMYGPAAAVFAGAVVQMIAVLMASRITTRINPTENLTFGSMLYGFGGSIQIVLKTPVVQGLLLLSFLGPMVLIPFGNNLLPVFNAEVFDLGPKELGLMLSSIGVGTIVGTTILASIGNIKRPGLILVFSSLLGTLSLIILAQSKSMLVATIACLFIGMAFTGLQTLLSVMLQQSVPEEFRGRIAGLFMASWGTVIFGSLVAGNLAENYGAPLSTWVGAIVVIVYATIVMLVYKTLFKSQA